MKNKNNVLSRYEIQRLIKYFEQNFGTLQSSESAEVFAVSKLEEIGEEIVKLALEVAKNNKRTTLSAKDIELVLRS